MLPFTVAVSTVQCDNVDIAANMSIFSSILMVCRFFYLAYLLDDFLSLRLVLGVLEWSHRFLTHYHNILLVKNFLI